MLGKVNTKKHRDTGRRILTAALGVKLVGYGEEKVQGLARHLSGTFDRSFEEKNLWRKIQFAEVYPEEQIVASLIRQDRPDDRPGFQSVI